MGIISVSALLCLLPLLLYWLLGSSTMTTSPLPYDCNAGLANAQMGWSVGKKAWCCDHGGQGCPTQPPPPIIIPSPPSGAPPSGLPAAPDTGPYDCEAGYHPCYTCLEKHWSTNKLNWCCQKKGKGCKSNTPLHM